MRKTAVAMAVALAAVVSAIAGARPSAQSAELSISPCPRPGIQGRVECGTLRVAENRDAPGGRTLSIFFVVVRATGTPAGAPPSRGAGSEPVFFFTGGPGSAASNSANWLTSDFAPLRATRDFVFIDQRGTGRSAPLPCAFSQDIRARLAPMFDGASAAACREVLAANADLRFYTTSDAARDVDDVRRALGYGRINLHGSSYGTKAAWEYAARFPARTRSMTLHGPAPPGFYLPLPFARGLDAALEGVIADCLAEAPCAARFPSLRRDVARAFDELRAKPARVTISTRTTPAVEADFHYGELAEAIRYQLYTGAGARRVPLLLTRAAAGDYSPIAQASVDNRLRLEQQLYRGMFMTVTCAEDVPFMTEAAIRAGTAGTRLGDYRVRQQIEACKSWPRGSAPHWSRAGQPAPAVMPSLSTPTLVQAGQFDPATPLEWAQRAMRLLPNGRLAVIPHGAHGFDWLTFGDCPARMTVAFITRGSARALDTSCAATARRLPFDLR